MTSPVVEAWAKSEMLMARAANGKLVLTPNQKISREDLTTNEEVVTPILKECGLRTTIAQILEHVDLFFAYARPRGKQPLPRTFPKFLVNLFF